MAAKQGPVSGDISHAAGALLHQGLHEVADPATKMERNRAKCFINVVFNVQVDIVQVTLEK